MVINRRRTLIVRCSVSTIFFLYTLLFCYSVSYCSATDVITTNSLISDERGETLVSAGKIFQLGFFTPPGSPSDTRRYVGIWNYKSSPRIVVWVANRDKPLFDTGGVFAITEDGNLKLLNSTGEPYWYTELDTTLPTNRMAKLMDSGNLVLSMDKPAMSILWQSFDHPTDTFLPGMKFNKTVTLTSWNGRDDPAIGNFSFMLDPDVGNKFIIKNRSIIYWRSGEYAELFSSDEMPPEIKYMLLNSSKSVDQGTSPSTNYIRMLVMNFNGEIQYWTLNGKVLFLIWNEPSNRCNILNACGSFGSCNVNTGLACKCLPGFMPNSQENWNSLDFAGGCRRKSGLCDKNSTSSFLSLKMMKVGNPDLSYRVSSEKKCQEECLSTCQCQAYSYPAAFGRQGSATKTPKTPLCWIWTNDLKNLQEEYSNGGRDLYVRVASSDIDVITTNSPISDERGETLVSAGEIFQLGFFNPSGSHFDTRRYLGIWYYKSSPQIVVWVANRDKPLFDTGGVFAITKDGNLKLLNSIGEPYWSTELESNSTNMVAKLMDSGNLVLSMDQPDVSTLWQSFDHPTDTFLPGMKFNDTGTLTSWNGPDDPASGNFSFTLVPDEKKDPDVGSKFIIKKRLITYWTSGESGQFHSSDGMPAEIAYMLSNFSKTVNRTNLPTNKSITLPTMEYNNTRLVMNFTGEIQYWRWDKNKGSSVSWREPSNRCSVFNACGTFGSCNVNSSLRCKCLPGFVPTSQEHWNSQNFEGGCSRKSALCGNKNTSSFLSLKRMKVGNPESSHVSESECRKGCLDNCQCQAYSYDASEFNRTYQCNIWTNDLKNLEEEYSNGGRDLYVRVARSDIEWTNRSCGTCGTNMIPYPLSTRQNCGDPIYFSFECKDDTGQVNFTTPSGTYKVTSINPDAQKFVIQANGADVCINAGNSSAKVDLQLNQSLPFYVTSRCNSPENETEIAWKPPPEPTCTSSAGCWDLPHSTCNATVKEKGRCLCNTNFRWNVSLLSCTQEPIQSKNNTPLSLIVGVTLATAIVLSCTIVCIYIWRRKVAKKQENKNNIQGNLARRLYDTERRVKDLIDSGDFKEEDKKGIDVPYFDLESILAATDSFSDVNKLGQGGYGPVYKGMFPGDQEIAVKRLSSVSGQGLQEFKNEVVLIAKLQHRNLVKLLGYCVKGDEKILLYEYMPNKSLDFFIFDSTRSVVLDWEMRFNIILGTARGLLYLHQDSRLRVIHRDMKTSNILLDEEMNPKISDFGLARIVGGKQTQVNTNRVVGTYGYMSPEYALEGSFSVKSDVFSFGVVVLEIISGKRSTRFYQSQQALTLLGYTWKLWKEEKVLDLMDPTLHETCNSTEFLKCVSVGLLCVQEDPSDRPTMSNVVFMLGSETATLPTPKEPAFVVRRGLSSTASSSSRPETITEVTTLGEGR